MISGTGIAFICLPNIHCNPSTKQEYLFMELSVNKYLSSLPWKMALGMMQDIVLLDTIIYLTGSVQ
jgi:hypothetical protein